MFSEAMTKEVDQLRERRLYTGEYEFCTRSHFMGCSCLDGHLKLAMEKRIASSGEDVFPAVDLTADLGVLTSNLALRYRKPAFPATLQWHSADPKPEKTRAGLAYLAQEATTRKPLFIDKDGSPVHAKDIVQLRNLSSKKYNEREGLLLGADDTSQSGRYAIKLMDGETKQFDQKPVSIKKENIFSYPATPVETKVLQRMLKKGPDKVRDFFDDLISRTYRVDLNQPETVQNLAHLKGRCALVTFINPSNEPSRVSQAALVLASQLLAVEGLLIQFDKVEIFEEDGFSNNMESLALQCRPMPLILLTSADCFNVPGNKMGALLWQKVPPTFDRMRSMERAMQNGEADTIHSFYPFLPDEDDDLPEKVD